MLSSLLRAALRGGRAHGEQAPQGAGLQQLPPRLAGLAPWVLARARRQARAQVPPQLRDHMAQQQGLAEQLPGPCMHLQRCGDARQSHANALADWHG